MVCIFFKYLLGTFHVLKTLASLKISSAFLFKYSMCVGAFQSPHLLLWYFVSFGEVQYKEEKNNRGEIEFSFRRSDISLNLTEESVS